MPEKQETEEAEVVNGQEAGASNQAGTAGSQTNWEEAYKGLQRKYNRLVQERDAAIKKLADASEKVKSLGEAASEVADLKAQIETMKTRIAELEGEVQAKDVAVKRRDIIAKDFPHLLPLEVEGLLPDADIESLPDILGKFSEVLENKAASKAKSIAAGATFAPRPGSEMSQDEIMEEMMALAGNRDPKSIKRYNELADMLINE